MDDFNGDGKLDILSSADENKLLFYWGGEGGQISRNSKASYRTILPQDGNMVTASDINGDDKADVIIEFNLEQVAAAKLPNGLRVLLST